MAMSAPIVLFGPQLPCVSVAQAQEICHSLSSDSRLNFVLDTVASLADVVDAVKASYHKVHVPSARIQLQALGDLLATGQVPDASRLGSTFFAPLTIIQHAIAYTRLGSSGSSQGFCMGFLSAAAVASSRSAEDLERSWSIAINLATCIGCIVDADAGSIPTDLQYAKTYSVRWADAPGKAAFDRLLDLFTDAYICCVSDVDRVSVTVGASQEVEFCAAVRKSGFKLSPIGLGQAYHVQSRENILEGVKKLCSSDARLRLSDASYCQTSLRSNKDGEIIKTGSLSEAALESVLVHPSLWFRLVSNMLSSHSAETPIVVQLGGNQSLPPSLSGAADVRSASDISHLRQSSPSQQHIRQLGGPIAVIGTSCRYPQADSLSDFWDLLAKGGCAVREAPVQRFDLSTAAREPRGVFYGNFLDSPDVFDHRFFGISGREAKSMDPQQRLALQVAYEAMESAGYPGKAANSGQNIGCYLGVGSVDYESNVASENATAFSATGTLRAFISGRISHHFGWTGPSITFDTACSSSAVAIHSACKALQLGECSMALAGGVNTITAPPLYQNLAAASFLSKTGASRAFDASADGYCRGEGCGIVLLKPLAKALADGDSVLGVIAGSAVNQGSNESPITVPHSDSQIELYQSTLDQAQLQPHDVSFVEAHGTGTPVGDPIECESIRKTFGGAERVDDLHLGSVKDNIGHAEAASGAAGLVKVLMMMHHRIVPKQANFKRLNPNIPPLESDKLNIPSSTVPWKARIRAALVNNYGAAGNNAAILIRQHAVKTRAKSLTVLKTIPFGLASATESSLRQHAKLLLEHIDRYKNTSDALSLANIAWNLARRQNLDFEHIYNWTSPDVPALMETLRGLSEGTIQPKARQAPLPRVLCFGGQGGDVAFIAREVYDLSAVLRKHLAHCEDALSKQNLPSLFPGIFDSQPELDTVALHSKLFSIQYSTAMTWIENGFEPSALLGHSFGQLTALCVAGALSLQDGIKFVTARAQLIRQEWGEDNGLMLSIEANRPRVDDLLAELAAHTGSSNLNLEIACQNGETSFVIAGATAAVEAFEKVAKQLSSPPRLKRLNNSHAYHSPLTDSLLPGLRKVGRTIRFHPASIHVETCSLDDSWPSVTSDRLVEHTRYPVYFEAAVKRLADRLGDSIWLEAGTSSPVINLVQRILKGKPSAHQYHPVDLASDANSGACPRLADTVAALRDTGNNVSFWPFHRSQSDSFQWLPLPPYQFEKNSHWIDYKSPVLTASAKEDNAPREPAALVRIIKSDATTTTCILNAEHEMFKLCVSGHAVLGQSLCPASMYLEMVLKAAQISTEHEATPEEYRIENLNIASPLTLSPSGLLVVELGARSPSGQRLFKIMTQSAKAVIHATGCLVVVDRETIRRRFASLGKLIGSWTCGRIRDSPEAETLSGKIVYKVFGGVVDYAKYYQGVRSVAGKDTEAVASVNTPMSLPTSLQDSICSPVMLDNFLQVAGIHVNCLSPRGQDEVYVCVGISEVIFAPDFNKSTDPQGSWTVYSNFQTTSEGKMHNDIYVLDSVTYTVVGVIYGAQFSSVSLKRLAGLLAKLNVSTTSETVVRPNQSKNSTATADLGSDLTLQVPARYTELTPPDSTYESEAETNVEDEESDDADSGPDVLFRLRKLLSGILEMPMDDIDESASLADLGVDSLLSTEVASEIQAAFNVEMDGAELIELDTINAVSLRIMPAGVKPRTIGTKTHTPSDRSEQLKLSSVPSPKLRAPSPPETPGEGICYAAVDAMSAMKNKYDEFTEEAGLAGFNSQVYPRQAELVIAYITQAFGLLGCDLASAPLGACVSVPTVEPRHVKPLNQYLAALSQGGIIEKSANGWVRTSKAVSQEPADLLLNRLVQSFPQHSSEHMLLSATGSKLAECLTGSADPIGLIFRDATARDLLQDVYTNAPMFKSGSIYLANYLRRVLSSAEPGRTVRILELGAGTGGTTGYLLSQLEPAGCKFKYMFTDLSPSLVAAAKRKFNKYDFMEYGVVDIEKSPDDTLLGQFDIIISTNCIHATRNLVKSTSNIRKVLREDGILCLVELTQNLYWFDLVFGLLEGWWLFDDGRTHALATANFWNRSLTTAGFSWVDWTEGTSAESDIMRVIVASPCRRLSPARAVVNESFTSSVVEASTTVSQESVTFKVVDGLPLKADISYPKQVQKSSAPARPIALMIHGGGHIMLSKRDVRPQQTEHLLRSGFLPISIDYRLCPETTLLEGPMVDVRDALAWIHETLKDLPRSRADVKLDTSRVVVIGWSTGGHLAMTTAWTAGESNLPAPDAILAFYCPSDYEDEFWTRENIPHGSEAAAAAALAQQTGIEDLLEGTRDLPLVAYNPPRQNGTMPLGGWMATTDARSRIALWMNWRGKHLNVLLNGLNRNDGDGSKKDIDALLPTPSPDAIRAVSPMAKIREGRYRTPTFMVHGTADDLIPWQQARATSEALGAAGVDAHCRIVDGAIHLFDIERGWQNDPSQKAAVWDGYAFLMRHVGL